VKVILGAGGTTQEGWISTDRPELDLTDPGSFSRYFGDRKADAFMAEHVWEHLDAAQGLKAAELCLAFLVPHGRLRIAVPDGLLPEASYIEWVRPGGNGPGADDHKMLFDHVSLRTLLTMAGFSRVMLLEWWDETGSFHHKPWDAAQGKIRRSLEHDARNQAKISYTSLIVDAIKGPL
jgi:predicted SAM-dependent methyltransferase